MPSSCLFSGIKKTEGLPEAVQVSFGSGMFFLFKERYFYLRIGIFFSTHKQLFVQSCHHSTVTDFAKFRG